VGKDAALAALIAARPPGSLRTVVTATTRLPRPGERDGVDYRFVSHSTFQAWLEEGSLLEHALVYGEYKGVPRAALEEVLATGADVALRVDVQGAAALRALLPGAVRIFLAAESEASLVRRLTSRKTEPLGALERRVGTARREVAAAREFDYGEWRRVDEESDERHARARQPHPFSHAAPLSFPFSRSRRQPGGRPGRDGSVPVGHH